MTVEEGHSAEGVSLESHPTRYLNPTADLSGEEAELTGPGDGFGPVNGT
jgi:hypothetical protein